MVSVHKDKRWERASSGRDKSTSAKQAMAVSFEDLESRQLMSAVFPQPAQLHVQQHEQATSVALSHRNVTPSHAIPGLAGTLKSATGSSAGRVGARLKRGLGAEPVVDGNVTGWVNVSGHTLFSTGGPSPLDIRQGDVSDCYFLSALADVAYEDPQLIRQEVTARGDGTFDVYFHNTAGWVDEHVDGYLPVDSAGKLEYAQYGLGGDIWVPIMEKAFAFFRHASLGASYSSLNFGWPSEALWDLGANDVRNYVLSDLQSGFDLASQVYGDLSQGLAVELGTNSNTGPLVARHAYAVMSVYEDSAGNTYLLVRNPWGTDGPNHNGYQWVNTATLLPQLSVVSNAVV